jgi:hypothetical protein
MCDTLARSFPETRNWSRDSESNAVGSSCVGVTTGAGTKTSLVRSVGFSLTIPTSSKSAAIPPEGMIDNPKTNGTLSQ